MLRVGALLIYTPKGVIREEVRDEWARVWEIRMEYGVGDWNGY